MRYAVPVFLLCCFICGCSQYAARPVSAGPASEVQTATLPSTALNSDYTAMSKLAVPQENGRGTQGDAGKEGDGIQTTSVPAAPVDQKIIYTAKLHLSVENFDPVPDQINDIVRAHGGYISETNVGQLQGTRRSGSWKIRVPAQRYRDFLQSASGLGVPDSLQENAQDVSEEYIDLEARIVSGKLLEDHVKMLLEKYSGKIEDLVAIERELARIRLDNERMEGKLRFLANQVSMSTVNLFVAEKTTYISAVQPTLGNRIKLEWSEAVGRTGRFLERTLLGLVANTFVFITWIVLLVLGWTAFRLVRRRIHRAPGPAEVTPAT